MCILLSPDFKNTCKFRVQSQKILGNSQLQYMNSIGCQNNENKGTEINSTLSFLNCSYRNSIPLGQMFAKNLAPSPTPIYTTLTEICYPINSPQDLLFINICHLQTLPATNENEQLGVALGPNVITMFILAYAMFCKAMTHQGSQ